MAGLPRAPCACSRRCAPAGRTQGSIQGRSQGPGAADATQPRDRASGHRGPARPARRTMPAVTAPPAPGLLLRLRAALGAEWRPRRRGGGGEPARTVGERGRGRARAGEGRATKRGEKGGGRQRRERGRRGEARGEEDRGEPGRSLARGRHLAVRPGGMRVERGPRARGGGVSRSGHPLCSPDLQSTHGCTGWHLAALRPDPHSRGPERRIQWPDTCRPPECGRTAPGSRWVRPPAPWGDQLRSRGARTSLGMRRSEYTRMCFSLESVK